MRRRVRTGAPRSTEELHERETAHAERDEVRKLTPCEPQPVRRGHGEDRDQAGGGTERPNLCESLGREARREDRLRDAAVQSPQRGGDGSHQVAEPGAPMARRLDRERRLAHLHSVEQNGT
jgi:hypothetical protein